MKYQDLDVEEKKKKIRTGLVLVQPQKLKKTPFEFSGLNDDEVLVKMECASLYDEDVACWEGGDGVSYPLAIGMPGKDGIGEVVETGKFSKFRKGDTVAVLHDRCLSEFTVCKEKEAVKIPEIYNDKHIPVEAFVHAIHTFKEAKISKGKSVILLGKGFFSRVIQELSLQEGANVISVANENGHLSNNGSSKGTFENISWYNIGLLKDRVNKLTDGKGCDIVIEFTGSEVAKDIAKEILKDNGSLVLTRKPDGSGKTENTIKTISIKEEKDIRRAEKVKDILNDPLIQKIDHSAFISHKIYFNEIEKAFEILCDNPDGYIKCVIIFD